MLAAEEKMTPMRKTKPRPNKRRRAQPHDIAEKGMTRTLCVDVGGTHVKAAVVDQDGSMASNHDKVETPHPCSPATLTTIITDLAAQLGHFDRVTIGFPGAVRRGIILTAPNLAAPDGGGNEWRDIDLARIVSERLGVPARLANDGEVQGLGAIAGNGIECILTLGTGMGFALFADGIAAPHLELGQHNAYKKKTYDEYVGHATLERLGVKKWNRHVKNVIDSIRVLVNFDRLYLGGGNARLIDFAIPSDVHVVSNETGITGGVRLWDGFNRVRRA